MLENENEGTNFNPNPKRKFLILNCKKCGIEISKPCLPMEKLISLENDYYHIKHYHLKCFTFTGQTKLHEKLNHLYDKVKCISCDQKFGRYIKACTQEQWDMIENIIFSKKTLSM
jgi:hypothetical protein